MQEGSVEAPPLAEFAIGRASRDMRMLAKLFDGFADPTRASILALLARKEEVSVGELVEAVGAPSLGFRTTLGAWHGAGTCG